MTKSRIDLVFEVSWEVCNKVGGIYTVLSSKSYLLNKNLGDNIIFIGPDFGNNSGNFTEDKHLYPELKGQLPDYIKVKIGRWNVPGTPVAILVDFSNMFPRLNTFYGEMWEQYGVDSLHAYGDYDESCAFSLAAAIVIGTFYDNKKKYFKNIIAHFNEWTTGMGLLYIKAKYPQIATVFTTHATSIGRSICGNNKQLYAYLKGYNGDQMAGELNMQSKHSLEKAAAHNADCFTTVSEITGYECAQLLEIAPHIVTPNGFEKEIAGDITSQKAIRKASRARIFKVVEAITGKKYGHDTLIVATSGRNEYKNKGIDVFLDAVNSLRGRHLNKQVIALVLVPAWVKEPRNDLQAVMDGNQDMLLGEKNLTHWLNNPGEDSIYQRIRQLNFSNSESENVDVVYIPCYLNGADGIINLNYYETLPGIDISIFPSYYEPWGYTPLESIAFGVPTITTSLSGFGQWINSMFFAKGFLDTGVAVVTRDDFNYESIVDSISTIVVNFSHFTKKEIETIKSNALQTASLAEWSKFIKYYFDAYQIAFSNRNKRKASSKQKIV